MEALSADLYSILNNSSSSDLTLICPDGEVQVHRCIMAGRSPVFNSLLKSDMVEKVRGIVKIEDFNVDVVRSMVLYIYTAKIEDTFDDIVTLMKIGGKYLIQTLVVECSKKLIKLITVSTVLELGAVAEVHSVQELMESCAQFVSENMDVLEKDWKEKLKSSPQFLMSIIEFMKSGKAVEVEVSRFGAVRPLVRQPGGHHDMWNCDGVSKDAISVQLSNDATLTSLGLFGTKNNNSIPVKISVGNSKSGTIFYSNTSYKSTGTGEPTRVPVNVDMVADTKYTISGVIQSGDDLTFYGVKGKNELNCGGKLKVLFEGSSESTNNTHVCTGQIPSLGFKI